MNFRPAKSEDAEALSALILSFKRSLTVDPGGAGAEYFLASVSTESVRSYIHSERYRYLVAEEGGGVAGFIAIRDRKHLYHLFVAPGYQRRGLARELWRRARAAAEADGPVEEFTVNSSLDAVPVYERFGFERISELLQKHGVAYVPMRCVCDGSGQRSGDGV